MNEIFRQRAFFRDIEIVKISNRTFFINKHQNFVKKAEN